VKAQMWNPGGRSRPRAQQSVAGFAVPSEACGPRCLSPILLDAGDADEKSGPAYRSPAGAGAMCTVNSRESAFPALSFATSVKV